MFVGDDATFRDVAKHPSGRRNAGEGPAVDTHESHRPKEREEQDRKHECLRQLRGEPRQHRTVPQAPSLRLIHEPQKEPAPEKDQDRVDRQQVPHRFDELEPLVEEKPSSPRHRKQVLDLPAVEQPVSCHQPPEPHRQPQEYSHTPDHHVLPGEPEMGSSGPLMSGRIVYVARHQLLDEFHVVDPMVGRLEIQEAMGVERVRLECTEGQSRHEEHEHGQDYLPLSHQLQFQRIIATLVRTPDRHSGGQQENADLRGKVDLACDSRAVGESGEHVVEPASPFGNENRQIEREQCEESAEVVHSEEMGLLDRHDGHGVERGGKEPDLAPVQLRPDEEHQHHRKQIERARCSPPYQINPAVIVPVQPYAEPFDDEKRKGAVGKEIEPLVVRAQGGFGRVEELRKALRPGKRRLHHSQEPLVRVDMLAFVPVQVVISEGRRQQKYCKKRCRRRQSAPQPTRRGRMAILHLPSESNARPASPRAHVANIYSTVLGF